MPLARGSWVVAAATVALQLLLADSQCGLGEWRCAAGTRCISLNKFCDGIEHCDDASDEPLGCTNCNRTFTGEPGVKYPLRVTGPFQRYSSFVCEVSFQAHTGSTLEITFLSFQIGRLEIGRNGSVLCENGYLRIQEEEENPEETPSSAPHFGQFCGTLAERSATYFSRSSRAAITVVVPSRASTPSSTFALYLTYRFLKRPPDEEGPGLYLGKRVPGTYCDREFLDCHRSRRCRIRTPNFPGFYPRNVTCNFFVRQPKAPEGYRSRVVLVQNNDYKISVATGRNAGAGTSGGATSSVLSSDCGGGDRVRVFDGLSERSPLLVQFCGSGSLPEVASGGRELLVQLQSAPYHHLSNTRLEIEVATRYELVPPGSTEEEGRGDTMSCTFSVEGARRRWGILQSPRRTLPPGANCTYRLIGATPHDRVWLYFISFISPGEKKCSPLEMFDGLNASDSPAQTFCGSQMPRMCAHAQDYPPRYTPPRPCQVPAESYLSSGPNLLLRHSFPSSASELLSGGPPSFLARYEFVDTSDAPLETFDCDRRIDSRLSPQGTLSNPTNVFLYGRGGRTNLTCAFHFVGLPGQKVRLTIRMFKGRQGLLSSCKYGYDTVLRRHLCREGDGWTKTSLQATEYWNGFSSNVGCICDLNIDEGFIPVVLESVESNLRLTFEAWGMGPFEDFSARAFSLDFEFKEDTVCEEGLQWGVGSLFYRALVRSTPYRCRWKVEASSPHKHLYLKFRGTNASSNQECAQNKSRLLVYVNPSTPPVVEACADTSPDVSHEFDVFSSTWHNNATSRSTERDILFIEALVSVSAIEVSWLEVRRPFLWTQGGRTLRNIECLHECPDIGACIDPGLWCDGVRHCPSGFDEAPEHCNYFPVAYVSCGAAGFFVTGCLLMWFTIRKRRLKRILLQKKRHFPADDFCTVESPVG